jgi:alpha-amylase/alpha-mannosidase (GH57 family)
MKWANFLHIYQPPTQKEYWVKRVADESYRKIFRGLLDAPSAKITMNANGVLLELLDKYGCRDVIDSMRELLARGQLELTGSAKYHAMLPFLPEDEVVRQIKLNEETQRFYFGDLFKPQGFFPPEMAFDPKLAPIIASCGYRWVIVDELSFPHGQKLCHDTLYTDASEPRLNLFFRERRMSWVILSGQIGTGNLLVQTLGDRLARDEYLLTAMDGETFGHHRPGLDLLLFEIYKSTELETVCISELFGKFTKTEAVAPVASTWALMEKDLERNAPFSRWRDPSNEIHTMQWELTDLAVKTAHDADHAAADYPKARAMLDRALHSDQYWWASARPWWSMEMIERGAKELYDSVALMAEVPQDTKEQARHLYHSIVFKAFDWQRSGKVDQLARSEDEDVRQRTDVGLPHLPKAEVQKMVDRLQGEMLLVAGRQEYERAAQVRDRINELKAYMSDSGTASPTAWGDREFDLKQ